MALLVRGGLTFHGDPVEAGPSSLYAEGGVLEDAPGELPADVEVLDASGCVVVPGLVIAHHHLYSALARGMPGAPGAPPETFTEILEKVWWRLDRALDLDLVETSALVGAVEALRCGVTGLVDHHASPEAIEGSLDRLAAGLGAAGARGVLCYETTDRHGDEGFERGLAENARFLSRPDRPAHVRGMVGGHAPFTLSDDHLAAVAALAARHDVAVHLHVAEADTDQADARRRGAKTVTDRLADAGILGGRAVLAHGVHLSEDELARLAEAGVWLTHQPRSNMNNHVGYLGRARDLAGRVALGTDGINGDLFDEAHAAFFRLKEHDRHGAAETVWSWIATGWRLMSEAFGLPAERGFGRLVPGAPADLVILDYDAPTPVHAGNLPWHLAFGLSARHVRDVVVGGEVVVRGGHPVRVDDGEVRERGRAGARRLWEAMESR